MVGLDAPDKLWTLDRIRKHIELGLPLVPLFNIDVIEASAERGAVRLREGQHVTRPGGSVAGPIQFALADVATYALILAARRDEAAVTVDLTINFLRPAMTLPLVAVATTLRGNPHLGGCSPPRCGLPRKQQAAWYRKPRRRTLCPRRIVSC
jgi:uncharacterized protein (TIGR00369 family)